MSSLFNIIVIENKTGAEPMKTISIIILSSILISFFTGCSNKQLEPKVEYIYKTKTEYVYLPCKKDNVLDDGDVDFKTAIIKSAKPKATEITTKPIEKYKQPKPTIIYAPKKYITRPNKKMDFMVGINEDGSAFVYMEGEFGVNTYKDFIRFLQEVNINVKEIKISSNGGLVSTAMQIGAHVHDNRWNTGLDKEMHCFSACGFVYFAGKEKSLEGKAKIGLHRPYVLGVEDTTKSIKKLKRDYLGYWNYIRAPKSVYDEMMEVDRENLLILDKSNINDYIDVKIKEGY